MTPTYTNLNDGIFNVENLNASTNVPVGQATCTGIVSAVRLKKQILEMKDSNNRPLWEMSASNVRGSVPAEGGGIFNGWLGVDNWCLSNIIPTNTTVGGGSSSSEVYYGDFQHAIVMQRSDIEFASTQVAGTAFQSDQTWMRVIRRYDFGLSGAAVQRCTGNNSPVSVNPINRLGEYRGNLEAREPKSSALETTRGSLN